jgi:hypothetical protein
MIVRRLYQTSELLAVLQESTAEMQTRRARLTENGRRLATLPTQIGCLGRHLMTCLDPWAACGRAFSMDSTVLRARDGIWHKKDREAGVVPHTRIDTQAAWTKSGWHGGVYGWKLHLICTVGAIWIPLAADPTPANVADNDPAVRWLAEVPLMPAFALGDTHYNTPAGRACCGLRDCTLVATQRGTYPHTDDGVEPRRVFHKLRSTAIENFNEQFTGSVTETIPSVRFRRTVPVSHQVRLLSWLCPSALRTRHRV